MPAKRPVPLSDAALGHKGESGGGDLTNQSAIGETNDGLPLPVKNTFIDMPSTFSPGNTPTDHSQPVSTAPAQVQYQQGFVRRAMLDSVEEISAAPDGPCSQGSRVAHVRSGLATNMVPATPPLMTPSPTGTSMFSDRRYELLGGAVPRNEVPQTVTPGQGQIDAGTQEREAPHPGFPLSITPSQAPMDMPYPNQSQNHHPYGSLFAPVREPAGALGTEFARLALGKADSDDEDADSEAERQQAALAASGRTIEDAPKPPPGALHPSLGSEFHESGTCKRCCFYPRNRCLNGYECEFCHYEHEKRKRKNKKNKKKKAEAGDQMDDFFAEGALTDLGWQPGQMQPQMPPRIPPTHPGPHPASTYTDAPLTYQWTDGAPGQTPRPPIIPGYEDYVRACCLRRLPGIEPPALATNPPPQQQAQAYYENHGRAPSYPGGYEAPTQLLPPYFGGPAPAPGALDPAAAPWVPPSTPPSQQAVHAAQAAPPADAPVAHTDSRSSGTTPERAKGHIEQTTVDAVDAPKTGAPSTNGQPERDAFDPPNQAMPNLPPPDSSPKLSTDLITGQQNPPPPDQSPTLPA